MRYEILYQELTHSTEMIRALLAGISQEEARLKPNRKSWSVLEVVCHLYDEEREDFREHLDFIISTSPNAGLHRQHEEWHPIAPQAWVKLRKYNEQDLGKMKAKFFRERTKSLAWLKGLKNADWNITYKSKFGSMRAGDMFASWVAHDNLHIRQLVELRRARIEKVTKPYKIRYAGEW
ncbi:MAG: DinB family protein [Chloroflexi bacterium]|nr:DinB family protein [Chloroflexota bacterium]